MNQQLQEAWAVLTADKKKATVLGVLALFAIIFWIRAALVSGPAKATASSNAITTTDRSKSIKNANASAAALGNADQESWPTITLKRTKKLNRDLFALSDALLASSAQMEQVVSDPSKSDPRKVEKLVRVAPMRVQTVEERVRDEALSLRLRSTMTGANPIAVIETADSKGRAAPVVRVGERIAGFELLAVRAREVDLEKEGVRVTLSHASDNRR